MTTDERLAAIEAILDRIYELLNHVHHDSIPQHLWSQQRKSEESILQKFYR